MIEVSLRVRPAVPQDQHQIANLMFFETHVHRHLDWRAPLEWLGSPFYWVVEDNGRVLAVLACPQDPDGVTCDERAERLRTLGIRSCAVQPLRKAILQVPENVRVRLRDIFRAFGVHGQIVERV